MSKFDEKIALYTKAAQEAGMKIDPTLLEKVTRGLGPSIYLPDASKVSCSDPKELERVKKRFLIKKMGLKDGPELDEAIKRVCKEYVKPVKHRALFYYKLVEKLKLEGKY